MTKKLFTLLLLFVSQISFAEERTLLQPQGSTYRYTVDTPENEGLVSTGVRGALPPVLKLDRREATIKTASKLMLDFYAGQRSPMTTVRIRIPADIIVTPDNTTVNVIGRGEVLLRNLPKQSIGRTGTHYSYNKVGEVEIRREGAKGTLLTFKKLDFRPANGPDIRLCLSGISLPSKGTYTFEAGYTTSEPAILHSPVATASLKGVTTVADFTRNMLRDFTYKKDKNLSFTSFCWTAPGDAKFVTLMQSENQGKTWTAVKTEILPDDDFATAYHLKPNKLYAFKLRVEGGDNQGDSNIAWYYSGLWDVRTSDVKGDGVTDDTEALNKLIEKLNGLGGGILYFPAGTYCVRTIHLLSNVWLHLGSDAVIRALPGADAPEVTWFSDRAYRSGLSPTDPRPYADPENYLTKQDVGHTFFHNAMFRGERIDNVKIVGTGRITGNGNIVTSDKVMNNAPEKRCDKMFSLKLCTHIEIGGWSVEKDLWHDPQKDEPYYIEKDGSCNYDVSNMLHIDQGGHFVVLATGTDGIHVHDTYFAKHSPKNARDIYDFMACNDVTVTNIYSRVSSDDIVKPGSDCSLGFTRPARNYRVRNIIGDTNCNLFQIGSETADDIQDLYVDNIYVLGANKAGFSISTNDGGHVRNVYLNSGKTGPIHSRSVMRRTRAPFFISISNRGRVLGADVAPFTFRENGTVRKELLVTNSNIGQVENIVIKGVDIEDVYGGSSFCGDRWKPYDGSQKESTSIIAGFKLPDTEDVEGGLTFHLPDGLHMGYIENVQFHDVNLLVKGGHPAEDAEACPPQLGVGRYNVGDFKTQPAFGFWARHVKGFVLDKCKIDAETKDGRYPVVLDDVTGAEIRNLQVEKGITDKEDVRYIRNNAKYILTPKAPDTPRINGAKVFGVRPGSQFLYTIPATGIRPMTFAVEGLPKGLKLNAENGQITGSIRKAGEYAVTFIVRNSLGEARRNFRIVVGNKIALTPPMGWNSWNCWGNAVSQEKVLSSAKAMVEKGLINHGWQYINIDDGWQGLRGGKHMGVMTNSKFPDMKGLADTIHVMGLKIGIYSGPWVGTYAGHVGSYCDNPDGTYDWTEKYANEHYRYVDTTRQTKHSVNYHHGRYSFVKNDVSQWMEWGIDYLKYDWNPNDVYHVTEMHDALRSHSRDVVLSLSNSAPWADASQWEKLANSWRTTGDIKDTWESMSRLGFNQAKWASFVGSGHWIDPDMLVVGMVGWGPKLHYTHLTPDEQYTHISLWSLLSSPLLIGCDMAQLDDFTLSLLTNDEVIEINQDPLGKQGAVVSEQGDVVIYAKPLEDGSVAVGLFNRGTSVTKGVLTWKAIGIRGEQTVRGVWRQQDIMRSHSEFITEIAPHGVRLLKLYPGNSHGQATSGR